MKYFFTSILLLFTVFTVIGQETTGILQGKLRDAQGDAVPFAAVQVIDAETNFKYGAVSQENGFYIVPNLAPSKYYRLQISFLGYTEIIENNVAVNLGAITVRDFILQAESTSLDAVILTGIATKQKTGNEAVLGDTQIKNTPTINRSIQDLTKNLPENNQNSFAGASNRFNNLNIDGIANNDVIGFQEPSSGAAGSAANGSPGGLSRSQPIGFGVIKQLSVKIAPFDVSIGNFSGASINVVTKNGTNATQGEVYAFGNNQLTLGNYADGAKQDAARFYDTQFGAGIGGAILKDKLFYYVNFEQAISDTPVLNAPGSESSNISLADVQAVSNRLISQYNYDPGSFTSASVKTSSTKLFARLDYNISEKHKLTLRNNYVNSYADNLEWNTSIFNFGNQGYRHKSEANSLAIELKSNYSNGLANNLTIGYNTVKEGRDFDGRVFPHLEILTNSSSTIFAGTYREASVFSTDFYTIQFADKLTYTTQNHTFSLGGLMQYHDVKYGFLSAWNGRWEYNSVDDFLNDRPRRVRGVYNVNNNDFNFVSSVPSATVNVVEYGAYLQDVYRVNNKLTVTGGLRLDNQFLPSDLPVSDEVRNTPEFAKYDNKLSNAPQLNPRFWFNYNIDDAKNFSIRGGSGLFSGRIPYLWFAYTEYISGTDYFNVDLRPTGTLAIDEDLSNLASLQSPRAEINLIDNDFTMPRDWKTNLAFEAKLPNKWTINIEGTYTDVVKGLLFQSLNRRDDQLGNFQGADDRPYYRTTGNAVLVNSNFTNVFLLTNTNQGYRYNLTLGVNKELGNYNGYLGYTYGKSKDISSTVRSSHAANFEWNQSIVGNDPALSFSNFDLRHKFVSSHAYNFNLRNGDHAAISFLYNGRSGSPYSFVYQGDPNRDGSSRNDLIYVPANQSEIVLVDIRDSSGNVVTTAAQQWQQLNNYIENDDYLKSRRGNYVERNGAKTPWNHELDMKLQYGKTFKNGKLLKVSFDVLNVLNFVNRDWGRLVFVPNVLNSSYSLLNFTGIANERPQYQFNIANGEKPYLVDLQNSRWRAQLGVTYSF